MAAAGTGLPGMGRGDAVTPLADTRGFGAGEAAVAQAFEQAAQGLGKLIDVAEPELQRQAKVIADQKVAAGQFEQRMVLTGADASFNQAMVAGTTARLETQRDADLDQIAIKHAFDPEGAQAAMQQYRSNAIAGAVPAALAPDWAAGFDQRAGRTLSTIRAARAEKDLGEARDNLTAMNTRLVTETIEMAQGRPLADVWADPMLQGNLLLLTRNIDELEGNPAFGLSPEEADAMRSQAFAQVKAGAVAAQAVAVLRTEGADAAYALLQSVQAGGGTYLTPSASEAPGLLEPGNINLSARPTVDNGDGTVSTVRSISVEIDGKTLLLPTVTGDGRVVSDEEAVALFERTGRHLGVFESAATADAYAETLHEDQQAGRVGADGFADKTERDLAFNTAREAVNSEISLNRQRANEAQQAKAEQERALNDAMAEDISRYALTGEGSGLTEAQVRERGGDAAVLRWYKGRSDAYNERELYRDLPNDPDAAAAEISRRAMSRGFSALPAVQDDGDLATLAGAIAQVESGNRDGLVSADPDGAGPAGGGAMGRMQLLPATARRMAGRLGIAYDENRLRHDGAYNQQLGQAYLTELLDHYDGDSFLAITAYHAGEGNVDGWLRSVGDPRSGAISREDWLNGVESRGNPRSAEYPRKVLAAMNGGAANAAWDSYRGQRNAIMADPAGAVQRDPAVQNAARQWATATGDTAETGEAYVRANLAAQERQGIPAGRRRTLPNAALMPYAQALARTESDPEAYQVVTDRILDYFGDAGPDVLQDVLILRGNSAFASQMAAQSTQAARAGTPPPAPARVAGAQRGEAVTRAASGSGGRAVQQMSDDEILRAAGLN